jgi:hypothetical protein
MVRRQRERRWRLSDVGFGKETNMKRIGLSLDWVG